MNNRSNIGRSAIIFPSILALLAAVVIGPQSASGYKIATYAIELYEPYGPEPDPRWQHPLPYVCDIVKDFRDNIDAAVKDAYCNSDVSRILVQDRYGTGFDNYDMAYWHAHSHTLPYNEHSGGDLDWWWDPDDLYNWGTSVNPYLPWYAYIPNPSWFEYPCHSNAGPGYTYGDSLYGKTVAMPMWHGYYGRFCGEALLTICDLSRHGVNKALGPYNIEWLVMDSCDGVRVAEPEGDYAVDDGAIAWDQTFAKLHGVYGNYVYTILEDRDPTKQEIFATRLVVDELTIWEAYKDASLGSYYYNNRRVSVITAENKIRYWMCFHGYCYWYYPDWDEMAINDHWWEHGYVSTDIPSSEIDYFYTTWFDPD